MTKNDINSIVCHCAQEYDAKMVCGDGGELDKRRSSESSGAGANRQAKYLQNHWNTSFATSESISCKLANSNDLNKDERF
jgi:hypothetical protein